MTELVMIGFSEKHRAAELLAQLQRLKFDWVSDLLNAVAVEVEADGRLRILQRHLLDPSADVEDDFEWKALLSAIMPMPHPPSSSTAKVNKEVRAINSQGSSWLKDLSLDQDFTRNAAALLEPGSSAILATIRDWPSAVKWLSGYSRLVLHTTIQRAEGRRQVQG